MEKAKKNYGEIFFKRSCSVNVQKCVGGIGKPEEVCACINKERNSGLTSAQHRREIVGLPETVYDFATLVMQWYVSGRVIPAHFLVSLVIRDAKLAVCETNLGQKDMGFLGFIVSHY